MRRERYTVSPERRAEFEQRDGEDPYQWIARQIDMATPFEATWLFMLRTSDQKQREAWEFHRLAVIAGLVVQVLCSPCRSNSPERPSGRRLLDSCSPHGARFVARTAALTRLDETTLAHKPLECHQRGLAVQSGSLPNLFVGDWPV